jgi:hypothetical protein
VDIIDRVIQLEAMADTMKKEATKLRMELEKTERKKPKPTELQLRAEAALMRSLTRKPIKKM